MKDNYMLSDKAIDQLLIDTLDMNYIEIIEYLYHLGYDQAVKDLKKNSGLAALLR